MHPPQRSSFIDVIAIVFSATAALVASSHAWGSGYFNVGFFKKTIDATPPTAPASVDDGVSTSLRSQSPLVSWGASTDEDSGISGYQVAIGTSPGLTNVYAWNDVGNVTSTTITGLSLSCTGATFYTTVRAKDNAGNFSAQTNGDGWTAPVCAKWDPAKMANTSLSNGDLTATATGAIGKVLATVGKNSGKWYWEVRLDSLSAPFTGIARSDANLTRYPGGDAASYGYYGSTGQKYYNSAGSVCGASYPAGTYVGVAYDAGAATVTYYKNCVLQCTVPVAANTYYPAVGCGAGGCTSAWTANFGASAFNCTVPSSYNAGLWQ